MKQSESTTSFSCEDARAILSGLVVDYGFRRDPSNPHRLQGRARTGGGTCEVRLPLIQPCQVEGELGAGLDWLDQWRNPNLVVLVQAGAAALGVVEEGKLIKHKVFTRYMVRAKQGKAQINVRGKSGASHYGSRLRMQNAIKFMADINTRLHSWDEYVAGCDSIFYSAPIRLWADLFRAKLQPPFARDDERLCKIPLDVRRPKLGELRHIVYELTHGRVVKNDVTSA